MQRVKGVPLVLFKITKMESKERQLKDLFKENSNLELVLPDFQRQFVWAVQAQKKLLATFIVNLPISNFLMVRGNPGDFAARDVCLNKEVTPVDKCVYLLDGQQRFSVLKNTFQNLFNDDDPKSWKTIWEKLFDSLKYRFFLDIKGNDSNDLFGYKNLIFDKTRFDKIEPSVMEGYIVEKKIMVKNINDFFHPGYTPMDKGKNNKKPLVGLQRRNQITREMAEKCLVPLYYLYPEGFNPLHSRVLEKISKQRSQELQEELEGDIKSIVKHLESTDEDIEEYLKENNKEKITLAWVRLEERWSKSVSDFLEGLLANKVFQIELKKEESSRAFAIFEMINLPGTPLNDYDLIVARAARNQSLKQLTIRLNEIISHEVVLPSSITHRIQGDKPKKDCPKNMGLVRDNAPASDIKSRFLQLLSINTYCKQKKVSEELAIEHLKRDKILGLSSEEINSNYQNSIIGVNRAYLFLRYRCGITKIEEIPYKLMVLPIAFLLQDEKIWKNHKSINRIEFWYWVSLFGGAYRLDQNSKTKDDIIALQNFINCKNPKDDTTMMNRFNNVLNVKDYSDKLTLMCENAEYDVPSSIQSGLLHYIISNQPYDFLSKSKRLNSWQYVNSSDDEYTLEDHHICPLFGKKTIKESTDALRKNKKEILNSPLNRTIISKKANRKIGPLSYDQYLKDVADYTLMNHYIKGPINKTYHKDSNETPENFYKRVCESRFNELKYEIEKELNYLID